MPFADTIPEIGEIDLGRGPRDPAEDPSAQDPRMILANSLMESIRQTSLKLNEDPNVVAERQLSQRSLGRRLLTDFLIGFQNKFSGTQTKDLRTQLVEREVLRQTMQAKQEQRRQALLQPLVQLLGQQTQLEVAETAQRGAFARTIARETEKSRREKEKLDAGQPRREAALELTKARTSKIRRDLEAPAVTFGSPEAAVMTSKAAELQKRNLFGTPEGTRELQKLQQEIAASKKSSTPRAPRVIDSGVDAQGRSQITLLDTFTGDYRVIKGPQEFTTKQREQLRENAEFIGSLRDVFNLVESSETSLSGRKFLLPTKLLEVFGAVSAEERALLQKATEALAARVRSFSGAQVTDRERVFLEGTMPRLFLEKERFIEGTISAIVFAEAARARLLLGDRGSRIDMTSTFRDLLARFEETGKLELPSSGALVLRAASRSGVTLSREDMEAIGLRVTGTDSEGNLIVTDEF